MKRVEFEVSDYYVKILRLFLSRADIGKRMIPSVSHAAVQRWETGMTAVSDRDLRRLQDVILNLAHEYERKREDFFEGLAELLRTAVNDGPRVTYRPPPNRKSKKSTALQERLIDLLHGKTRRSTAIIETLVEEGYTGALIQKVSTDMGIKKTVKGFGPNRKSYWSLK